MNHRAILFGEFGGIGQAMKNAMLNNDHISDLICCSRNEASDYKIDYNNEQSIIDAAQSIQSLGYKPSVIFVATGFLSDENQRPETQTSQFSVHSAQKNYLLNCIGPALIARSFLPLMDRNKPAYFAALSAKVGSISDNELGGWHSYRASKAALNMLIKNMAIEWKRKNKQSRIIAMHPGTVDTMLSKPFQRNVPDHQLFSAKRAATQLLDILLNCPEENTGQLISWDGSIIAP